MSDEEDANSILTLMVLEEAQVVTYRRLSRELRVHVNVAKQQLASFFEKNQSKCHATYLVTGSVEGSGFMVKLVPVSQVVEAQKGIGSSTCHIYSVEPHKLEDLNVLVTANLTTGSIRDTLELGAVGSSVTQVTADSKSPSIEQPTGSAIPVPKSPVKKEEPKDSKSFFGHSVTKYAMSQEDKEDEGGASSQQPSPPVAKPTKRAKPTKQAKPAKPVKQEKEEEDDDDDIAMDVDTQEAADTSTSRVEDMFDDDFDMEPSNQQQSKTTDTQDTFDSIGDSQRQSAFSDDSQQQQPSTSDSNGRMRKRRKVTREKHTKNSRGMLVTEFVEEWESCSSSEPEDSAAAVKKKPAAPTTNTSKGGGKRTNSAGNQQQQSSLLRFFGKK